MDTLHILITIYVFALLSNVVNTFALWYHNRNPLYKILMVVWGGTILNFSLQGIFDTPGIAMLLSFSTYLISSLALVQLFYCSLKVNFRKKPYLLFGALGIAVGAGVFTLTGNYRWAAFPVAIIIAAPMLITALKTFSLFKAYGYPHRFFAVFLFINGLHFLDYPYLRTEGEVGSIIGFSLALFIVFAMSIFLPAFILRNLNREYTAKLEKEVAERTLSLTEKNKQLLAITKENLSLINIVCHDLGTPISVLNSSFDFIHANIPAEEKLKIQPRIDMTLRSLKAINEILEKVKNLEALKSGKIHVELAPVDLIAELKESVSLFTERLDSKHLHITWDCQLPANLKVLADSTILRHQILNNLISNAIKFSEPNNEIKISVFQENEQVSLRIRDHGVGIPEKMIPKLFDFETKTTRRGTQGEKGTGFGLPLVKTCVEKFGGQIHVQSHVKETGPDHGSVFVVELKVAA